MLFEVGVPYSESLNWLAKPSNGVATSVNSLLDLTSIDPKKFSDTIAGVTSPNATDANAVTIIPIMSFFILRFSFIFRF